MKWKISHDDMKWCHPCRTAIS